MSASSLEEFRAYKKAQEARRARPSVRARLAGRRSRSTHAGSRARVVASLVGALVLALVGTVAWAAWTSTGSGAGAATGTSVNKASAPTVTRVGGTASITWNAVTLANGVAVSGYQVLRHVNGATTTVCTTSEPTRTCTDGSPVGGTQQYGVVATRGSWTGPESDLTAFVGDTTAPTSQFISRTPTPNGNGWSKADVLITIKATDAGSGLKSINANYSNMDVEVPVSGASDQAIFQVSREDANSFSYWSVDNAGNVETRQTTATVKIDKTVPVTTAAVTSTGTLVNGYYNKTASVALSATDVSPNFGAVASGIASMQYQLGGTSGTWLTYTTAIPVNDGTTTVYFRSTDLADNTEDPRSVTVKVDSAAPTTTITRTGDDTTWNKNDVAVTLNATDAVSGVKEIHYTVTGGTEQVVTGATASFTVSREDANALVFWAIDKAANEETPHKTATVKLDKTAPATTSSTSSNLPGNGGWSRQAPVTVTLTPADSSPTSGAAASGVASTQYLVTTTNTVPTDWSGATTGTSLGVSTEGTRYVWFRSTDVAGNTEAGKVQQVLLDTTAPTLGTPSVTGTAGSNGWYVGATAPVVKFTASDNTSGVSTLEYRIGAAGTWTTYNAANGITVPEATNANGTDLYFRATDVAGNLTTSAAYYVKYDKTGPSAPTATTTPGAPDGTSPWYVNAPKVAGGASTDSTSGVDHYEYQLNGAGGWSTAANGFTVPDGSPQVVGVRAVDRAGNVSATTVTAGLSVDTAKPTSVIEVIAGTQGNNSYYTTNPTLRFTATDPAPSSGVTLQLSTNGGAYGSVANGATLVVTTEGASTFSLKSTDAAGNTDTQSVTIKLDRTAPSAGTATITPATPNGSNGWYISKPSVTLNGGTDTGGSGYAATQYQYDATTAAGWLAFSTQFLTVPETTSAGTTLYWRGIDAAGNATGTPASQPFKVDVTAPTMTANPDGTAFPKNGWKNQAGSCEPSGGNPGTNRLCVTVADTGSGRDTGVAGTYVLYRLSGPNGTVQSCYNEATNTFAGTSSCATANPLSWNSASSRFQSAQISTSDIAPGSAVSYYRWTVSGLKDMAGNTVPTTSYTFSVAP